VSVVSPSEAGEGGAELWIGDRMYVRGVVQSPILGSDATKRGRHCAPARRGIW
ncbi:MAG: hypothetical protein QOF37_1592, partial [Thermoleophilaceae bacterium]|nr:hypothetical protein [Thermoleophilaceae bacterium]